MVKSGALGAHRRDKLQEKARAVLDRTAIVVVTPVAPRRQELLGDVAAPGADVDAVEAALAHTSSGRRKGPHQGAISP
jgi:hypothetical protein